MTVSNVGQTPRLLAEGRLVPNPVREHHPALRQAGGQCNSACLQGELCTFKLTCEAPSTDWLYSCVPNAML